MSKNTPILTSTTTLFKAAETIARSLPGDHGQNKKKILDLLAKEISGPNHDWGYLTGSDTTILDRKMDLATANLRPARWSREAVRAVSAAMTGIVSAHLEFEPGDTPSDAEIAKAIAPYVELTLEEIDARKLDFSQPKFQAPEYVPDLRHWYDALTDIWSVDPSHIHEDRAALMKRPSWRGMDVDSEGNPRVWKNHYRDENGREWSSTWSCQCDDDDYGPYESEWIGPDAPEEYLLWSALPEAGADPFDTYDSYYFEIQEVMTVFAPKGLDHETVARDYAPAQIAMSLEDGRFYDILPASIDP